MSRILGPSGGAQDATPQISEKKWAEALRWAGGRGARPPEEEQDAEQADSGPDGCG